MRPAYPCPVLMDMMEALNRARAALGASERFDVRTAFGKRNGKQIIFPVGLGSALAKAVREGYLEIVGTEGSKRRGRTYIFTDKGRNLQF
ncbi:MAG: hypothetical protein ACYDCK_13830 [Thermoplasmatota archaeon]